MRSSLNPLMYKEFSYSKLFESAGTYRLLLSPGTYYVAVSGGGGAGGEGGGAGGQHNQGNGGAGGTASIVKKELLITQSVTATVYVGAGGKTKTNGGNGGLGGPDRTGIAGGSGGGGGYPSYIKFSANIQVKDLGSNAYQSTNVIVSNGGGGGGGGGAPGYQSRYSDGGSGGGGGGYYRYNASNGNIVSVPGKDGSSGGIAS